MKTNPNVNFKQIRHLEHVELEPEHSVEAEDGAEAEVEAEGGQGGRDVRDVCTDPGGDSGHQVVEVVMREVMIWVMVEVRHLAQRMSMRRKGLRQRRVKALETMEAGRASGSLDGG